MNAPFYPPCRVLIFGGTDPAITQQPLPELATRGRGRGRGGNEGGGSSATVHGGDLTDVASDEERDEGHKGARAPPPTFADFSCSYLDGEALVHCYGGDFSLAEKTVRGAFQGPYGSLSVALGVGGDLTASSSNDIPHHHHQFTSHHFGLVIERGFRGGTVEKGREGADEGLFAATATDRGVTAVSSSTAFSSNEEVGTTSEGISQSALATRPSSSDRHQKPPPAPHSPGRTTTAARQPHLQRPAETLTETAAAPTDVPNSVAIALGEHRRRNVIRSVTTAVVPFGRSTSPQSGSKVHKKSGDTLFTVATTPILFGRSGDTCLESGDTCLESGDTPPNGPYALSEANGAVCDSPRRFPSVATVLEAVTAFSRNADDAALAAAAAVVAAAKANEETAAAAHAAERKDAAEAAIEAEARRRSAFVYQVLSPTHHPAAGSSPQRHHHSVASLPHRDEALSSRIIAVATPQSRPRDSSFTTRQQRHWPKKKRGVSG